ncbi:response regulator [Actinoplanes utahensis]|uniref:response regulator n=1 Tax=Actinoplanes utahensis TaxID=1869 RepID=UPI00068C69A5|nr:response regulator transcription factor [Actinoplanes utahensis]GIF28924.1 hypothetical protein Aut01nite_19100 [Actinoplanes utahensis]
MAGLAVDADGTTEPIRVLVVDDEALVRAGFRVLLETSPGLTVVGEAADGAAAIRQSRALRPDVLLMDIRMPAMDGLEATRHIAADASIDARLLIVTTFGEDEHVFAARSAIPEGGPEDAPSRRGRTHDAAGTTPAFTAESHTASLTSDAIRRHRMNRPDPAMSSRIQCGMQPHPYLPVIGTLLGALIGSVSTFLIQRSSFERERRSRLFDARRTACLTMLCAFHQQYLHLLAVHEENTDGEEREKAFRRIESDEGQSALDGLRLVMDGESVRLAREFWQHLRGTPFAKGREQRVGEWKIVYWNKRTKFFEAVSRSLAADL